MLGINDTKETKTVCIFDLVTIVEYKTVSIEKTRRKVEMVGQGSRYRLEEILTKEQVKQILEEHFSDGKVQLVASEARPAVDGLAGYLGDHVRVALHVKCEDKLDTLRLFVKRMPMGNKPKADLIAECGYFSRENFMFQLLEEMRGADDENPWCCKAYIHSESLLVMPDLAATGYLLRPLLQTLDLPHVLCAARSIARLHAAFANYETSKTSDVHQPFQFYNQFSQILAEPTFRDTPYVRTGAKLTADLIATFLTKYGNFPHLEDKLAKAYVQACETLDVADRTLNVLVHKDLWINNVLFKYEGEKPTNALLLDYQCIRYGPPAFDLTGFLYLTTSRTFREENESCIFKHYFETFSASLEDGCKKRLDALGYDEDEFLSWCEKARMFGAVQALLIFPQVLMDGVNAQRVFDDPSTFKALVDQDRSQPVIGYARQHPDYLKRNLEVSEEFIERYVSRDP